MNPDIITNNNIAGLFIFTFELTSPHFTVFTQNIFNIATHIVTLYGRVSSVCDSRHRVISTVVLPSLHIPPVCQHVYPVSWSILAVVLTCVSNGRDVSSEGQPNEGNDHYQNRDLLEAQQDFGQEGGRSPMLDPLFRVVWRLSAAPKLFSNRNSSSRPDLMGWTDGGHVMW